MVVLTYPFEEKRVRALRVGDVVRLSGRVFTGRDRLHGYLFEGGKPPVDLSNGAIYHCGPVVVGREGAWKVKAAGPTTSLRHEQFMAEIIRRHGVRIVIGKGGMGRRTLQACADFGCVYLQAVGGCAGVLAAGIQRVEGVRFLEEFGSTEALWIFQVSDLEAVVTMDSTGKSLYEDVRAGSCAALDALISKQAFIK